VFYIVATGFQQLDEKDNERMTKDSLIVGGRVGAQLYNVKVWISSHRYTAMKTLLLSESLTYSILHCNIG